MTEARPLLRAHLKTYEETLRSDMVGGSESVDLIPPLTLLSYTDMLAGMKCVLVSLLNADRLIQRQVQVFWFPLEGCR